MKRSADQASKRQTAPAPAPASSTPAPAGTHVCTVATSPSKGYCFVRAPGFQHQIFLHVSNTSIGVLPPVDSLVLCSFDRGDGEGKIQAKEIGPLYTQCTVVTSNGNDFSFVRSEILHRELGGDVYLRSSNCEDGILPAVGSSVTCRIGWDEKKGKPFARSKLDLPIVCDCIATSMQNGTMMLRSPVVEYGSYLISMELKPGAPIPVIGSRLQCWLVPDNVGDLWASTTPPPVEIRHAGVLEASCVCESADDGVAVLVAVEPEEAVTVVGSAQIVLTSISSGIGCLPIPGETVRCWLRESSARRWTATMLPRERDALPPNTRELPSRVASPNVFVELDKLPPVDEPLPDHFRLSAAIQQELSGMYVAPALQLSRDIENRSLFVLCDADLCRISDRWNLGMDIVPLGPGRSHWCQLMHFHSPSCLDRFVAQLRLYFLCRKPSSKVEMLITSAPHVKSIRTHAASLPQPAGQAEEVAPVIAIDCLTAKSKDDALQVFLKDQVDASTGAKAQLLVARAYIATPFKQSDVKKKTVATTGEKQKDFFASFPPVLHEARKRLVGNSARDPLFEGAADLGLSSSESKLAVCYEQMFTLTKLRQDGNEVEDYIPHGSMTVSLKQCRLHAELTFEQVDAFEDGDLQLPQPVADSIKLLRLLVDSLDRQYLAAASPQPAPANATQSTTADADEILMPTCGSDDVLISRLNTTLSSDLCISSGAVEDELVDVVTGGDGEDELLEEQPTSSEDLSLPIRMSMEVRPELDWKDGSAKFYRVTIDGVPTTKQPRVRLLAILHFFRDEQNAALFLAYGFTLKSDRFLSDEQQRLLNAKCAALGRPPPNPPTFDAYLKTFNFTVMSRLLEVVGSPVVETKVPRLYVEEGFLRRLGGRIVDELKSSDISTGLYWHDKDPAVVPKMGVDDIISIPSGTLPIAQLAGGFLVSTHPLREYNHLLAQFLILTLGHGRHRRQQQMQQLPTGEGEEDARYAVADEDRIELMRHSIAALLELNHANRSKDSKENAMKQEYLFDAKLPYKRSIFVTASLVNLVRTTNDDDDEDGAVTLVFVSSDLRSHESREMIPIHFVIGKTSPSQAVNPLALNWPTSFGTRFQLIVSCAGHSAATQLDLIPAEVSYTEVLTTEDWGSLCSKWQGSRIMQLLKDAESSRGVQPSVKSAQILVPGRLALPK